MLLKSVEVVLPENRVFPGPRSLPITLPRLRVGIFVSAIIVVRLPGVVLVVGSSRAKTCGSCVWPDRKRQAPPEAEREEREYDNTHGAHARSSRQNITAPGRAARKPGKERARV